MAGLAAAAAAGWYWRRPAQLNYQTQPVERGEVQATISATGTCNAVVTVQVGSQVSGNIKSLMADFNTEVKKGQLVALIDPELFEARVTQAQASLGMAQSMVVNAQAALRRSAAEISAAEANLLNQRASVAKAKVSVLDAKTKLARRIQMFQQGLLSLEDKDTAQAAYDAAVAAEEAAAAQLKAADDSVRAAQAQKDVAEAQLASAQAQVRQNEAMLAQARTDLRHTEIRAPVDGVVIARRVDVGQTVAASFQAPTIFEIAQDLTKMQVDTNVDESDIGRVQLGQQAVFTVDAYPGVNFQGSVAQIRQAAINVQNVISYDVVVAVSNAGRRLFPGMTASVRILTEKRTNVLKLPNAALRVRLGTAGKSAEQPRAPGASTVWVLGPGGNPKAVRVRLGITDGVYSAIDEGELTEATPVIVSSPSSKAQTQAAPRLGGPRI